ncbi:MAG: response regulator [Pseudomonadota bacterium]
MDVHILVADDDENIREMLSTFLGKFNYQVDTAANADEAMGLMQTRNYDIVLTDKNMPDDIGDTEAGMQVLKYAKDHMPGAEVIMITGYATIETAIEAMKIGAFDYIMKPVPLEELKEKIDRILNYRRFMNADNNVRIYKVLHQQVLELLRNQEKLPEDQVQRMLKQIGGRIDHVFGLQREYEDIIQGQADALKKIEQYTDLLADAIPTDSPYVEVLGRIRTESKKRLLNN